MRRGRRQGRLFPMFLAALAFHAVPAAAAGPDPASLERAAHAVFTGGNRVRIVTDPEAAYRLRLDAVRSARHHVLLSVPIWRTDPAGQRFLEAFARIVREKRRTIPGFQAFVEFDTVTFIPSHDWFGTVKRTLRRAGATVRFFNPSTWIVTATYEARQHDKLLVVDGRIAVLGGRNIGREYFVTGEHWTDLDAVVEGPAVLELQMMFLKTWVLMRRWNLLHNALRPPERLLDQARSLWRTGHLSRTAFRRSPLDRYFEKGFFPEPVRFPGGVPVLVLWDMPLVHERAPTLDVILELVASAEARIDIVTPYSTFPEALTVALEAASRRGVRIRVVTSSRTHHNYGEDGWLATLGALARLASAGVAVYGWAPERTAVPEPCHAALVPGALLHAKFLQVDGHYAVVHSSNFNYRSSYYNTEAGILVADPALANTLAGLVDRMTGADGRSGPCDPIAARAEPADRLEREYRANLAKIRSLERWSFVQ